MEKFIKYCCLCTFALSLTAFGNAADTGVVKEVPKDAKEKKCPEGQIFDKDVGACITAPPTSEPKK